MLISSYFRVLSCCFLCPRADTSKKCFPKAPKRACGTRSGVHPKLCWEKHCLAWGGWFSLLDCWTTDPGYSFDPQDSNHIETSGEPSEFFGGLRSCHGWNCWTCCSNVSFVFDDAWSEERNEPNAVPCGEEHLCSQRASHREDLSNYTLHVRLLWCGGHPTGMRNGNL